MGIREHPPLQIYLFIILIFESSHQIIIIFIVIKIKLIVSVMVVDIVI